MNEAKIVDELWRMFSRQMNEGSRNHIIHKAELAMLLEHLRKIPGLLWPEGEKWMGDDSVRRAIEAYGMVMNAGLHIRDRAQVAIDAKDAELTRLRAQLEEANRNLTKNAEGFKNRNAAIESLQKQLEEARKDCDRQYELYYEKDMEWREMLYTNEKLESENAALKKEVEELKERCSATKRLYKNAQERQNDAIKKAIKFESSRDEFAIKFAEWAMGNRRPQTWFASTEDLLRQFKETINETPGTADPS